MNRKDYIKLAAVLREARPVQENEDARSQWRVYVRTIAAMLIQDNSAFNNNTFLIACGFE